MTISSERKSVAAAATIARPRACSEGADHRPAGGGTSSARGLEQPVRERVGLTNRGFEMVARLVAQAGGVRRDAGHGLWIPWQDRPVVDQAGAEIADTRRIQCSAPDDVVRQHEAWH